MIGAIIGDIVGSRFEWANIKTKDFKLFTNECRFTDDTVMSIAVAYAILKCNNDYKNLSRSVIDTMTSLGNKYINAGYGGSFIEWLMTDKKMPYNSWGNGSAMRVSAVGWIANSEGHVKDLSRKVTEITHNHEEGIKGAEATAMAIYLARTGFSKEEIKKYVINNYYKIDFTLDDIRPTYTFDVSCQGSVPQALEAFFESKDFEDCIRNAISIGGDSDTIACIAGSVAEAYYGVPEKIKKKALSYLTEDLQNIVVLFDEKFVNGKEKINNIQQDKDKENFENINAQGIKIEENGDFKIDFKKLFNSLNQEQNLLFEVSYEAVNALHKYLKEKNPNIDDNELEKLMTEELNKALVYNKITKSKNFASADKYKTLYDVFCEMTEAQQIGYNSFLSQLFKDLFDLPIIIVKKYVKPLQGFDIQYDS